MKKQLTGLLAAPFLIAVLFILIRGTALFINGYDSATVFSHLFTPLQDKLFWQVTGIVAGGILLWILRDWIADNFFAGKEKMKVSLLLLIFLGVIIGAERGMNWYQKTQDQQTEYHYEVPQLSNSAASKANLFPTDSLVRGASVFGWERVDEKSIAQMTDLGINRVALMPFEYQEAADAPELSYLEALPALRRKDSTFIELIKLCRRQNTEVMLKPHLWIESAVRVELALESDADWEKWFDDYAKVTLAHARIAQSGGAEIFCIGTELRESVKKQPDRWYQLIDEIRKIYRGKLTYAANWDKEYQLIPFWDRLDYIGVQAYFPLKTKGKNTPAALRNALRPHADTLGIYADSLGKPVLFTEYGFRSIRNNTAKPWAWPVVFDVFGKIYCEECQAEAYQVLWEEMRRRPWFAGGYLWEYDFEEDDGPLPLHRLNFSPRHKKTEKTIKEIYGRE